MPTAISTQAAARKVKASAPKVLTITKATAEAGRIARRIMPDALVTVDSRDSFDLATDVQTVITTVTFPANTLGAELLSIEMLRLSGRIDMRATAESITITRRVR